MSLKALNSNYPTISLRILLLSPIGSMPNISSLKISALHKTTSSLDQTTICYFISCIVFEVVKKIGNAILSHSFSGLEAFMCLIEIFQGTWNQCSERTCREICVISRTLSGQAFKTILYPVSFKMD